MPDMIDEDVSEQEEPTCDNESDDSAARFSDYIISTGESTERSDEDMPDNTSSRSQQETAVTTPTTSLVLVRVRREVMKIRLTTRLPEVNRKPYLRNQHRIKKKSSLCLRENSLIHSMFALFAVQRPHVSSRGGREHLSTCSTGVVPVVR